MYLARKTMHGTTRFIIRESYKAKGDSFFKSRDLFDLGRDPRLFIHYPGGNAFYIDSIIEHDLDKLGIDYTNQEVEDLLWPFVTREIRWKVEQVRSRHKRFVKKDLTKEEKELILNDIHIFDKRRLHYLRYGSVSQAKLYAAPLKLFRRLLYKSRDELEQYFLAEEQKLDTTEYRKYVYVIFNLQRFFTETVAQMMPQGLDQNRLDESFLKEFCVLDADKLFWAGFDKSASLKNYLHRYVIMFFDYDFQESAFFDEYIRQFMNSHRTFKFPEKKVALEEGSRLFGVSQSELKKMSKRDLTRIYRKLALKHHPDKGGEQDEFVKLTEIYTSLIKGKK